MVEIYPNCVINIHKKRKHINIFDAANGDLALTEITAGASYLDISYVPLFFFLK